MKQLDPSDAFQQIIETGVKATRLTHLQRLESESIYIFREVVAECEKPVMLYSIGKDSAVMLHLARKAFYPAPPPFALLHVDTTWKFREMYAMRERMARETAMELFLKKRLAVGGWRLVREAVVPNQPLTANQPWLTNPT